MYSCPSLVHALKHEYTGLKAIAWHARARWALFKGQISTAHGRGGLVPFVAPKVTKRRAHVIRNASLPHRPLRTIRQNHGLQHSFPTDRSRWAHASESAVMPPFTQPDTVLPDFGRSCSADRTGPTLFYLPFKNFVIARSSRGPARRPRRGNRKVCL